MIFLAPKLEGKRFDDHTLPVSLLEDFSALEELIIEVSKKIFLEENPHRKRVPKGFTDNISLKLSSIEEGSVIPKIILATSLAVTPLLPDAFPESTTYVEKARDRVLQVISNAKQGTIDPDLLDQKYLNYFNRIGKSLEEDESINFLPNTNEQAILNKTVRKKILLSRNEKIEYSDAISVSAYIPAIDQKESTFNLDIGGLAITCDLDAARDFYDTILLAVNEYKSNTLVSVKATGIFNEKDTLIRIEGIESMDVLDPYDVDERLNQLSKIQDKWYDGFGKAPNAKLLRQFGEYFNSYYNQDLPLPSIFPTVEGNIQLEWSFQVGNIFLEVFLNSFSAELLVSKADNTSEEDNLRNLRAEYDWKIINEKINNLAVNG